jgi:hypothetical protein
MDKKNLLLLAMQKEMDFFGKQSSISKKELIIRFLHVQLLEFQKIKIEKEEIYYKIFKDVDPIDEFSKKYKLLVKAHNDIKQLSKEDLLKGLSKMEVYTNFIICANLKI